MYKITLIKHFMMKSNISKIRFSCKILNSKNCVTYLKKILRKGTKVKIKNIKPSICLRFSWCICLKWFTIFNHLKKNPRHNIVLKVIWVFIKIHKTDCEHAYKKVKEYSKISHRKHSTCDTWHVTHDTWHVACEIVGGENCPKISFPALMVWDWQCL